MKIRILDVEGNLWALSGPRNLARRCLALATSLSAPWASLQEHGATAWARRVGDCQACQEQGLVAGLPHSLVNSQGRSFVELAPVLGTVAPFYCPECLSKMGAYLYTGPRA